MQADDLLLDKEWHNICHKHTGFPRIGNRPLNSCLQVLFHTPQFVNVLDNIVHTCPSAAQCVSCCVLKIWQCVKDGSVDVAVLTQLLQLLPGAYAFDMFMGMVSNLHYDLEPFEGCNESPITDIFSGKLRNKYMCSKCGVARTEDEFLLCLQLLVDGAFHLQHAMEQALSNDAVKCSSCSADTCVVSKEIVEPPKVLLIHPVRKRDNTGDNSFYFSHTVEINETIQYRVIGSIQNNKTAVVRCPNNSLLSIENRKMKAVSWEKFTGTDMGATCNFLVYGLVKHEQLLVSKQNPLVREVISPVHIAASSPVNESSTINLTARSTSNWSVTIMDNESSSYRRGALRPRQLYRNGDSDPQGSSAVSNTSSSASASVSVSEGGPSRPLGVPVGYRRPANVLRRIASYPTCVRDPTRFKFFTGLSVYNFQVLFLFLGGRSVIRKLKMKYNQKTPQKIRKRCLLSSENKLFMFLVRLRRGTPLVDLAYIFGVSTSYCGSVVYTMLRHLFLSFKCIEKQMFISAEEQNHKKAPVFRPFPKLRCIIDGLEIFVETPSNFEQNGNLWSNYKSHTTYRFIIGISCYGTIMFLSDGFEGNMSEKEALLRSGFYDLFEPGDVVMSDRGFDIDNELLRRGIDLIKPPSRDGRDLFTVDEDVTGRAISAARVYVEHAVRLIKVNRLFKPLVPLTLVPTLSDYVYVAGALANFGTKSFKPGSMRN